MKIIPPGRPTEFLESDTYICESLYEESRRQIKKLASDGLKKYTHSPGVIQDEIYFFRRPIQPQRVSSGFTETVSVRRLKQN